MLERLSQLFAKIEHKPNLGPVDCIVAGLGNPLPKYEQTRHNAGFWFIDRLCRQYEVSCEKRRFSSLTGEVVVAGKRCLLLKPQTYMNLSGQAIAEAARFYKLPMERVFIVFDDVSLEPGKLRIRKSGSAGGHNGIKSIIEQCGTDQFPRIKIGVGKKPRPDYDLAKWVLGTMPPEQKQLADQAVIRAVEALELLVQGQFDAACNRYN